MLAAGDQVVCVENDGWDWGYFDMIVPEVGAVYTIAEVRPDERTAECPEIPPGLALVLVELPNNRGSYPAECFRKVQRRDLSAWLATSTDFEEPKRAPVTEPA